MKTSPGRDVLSISGSFVSRFVVAMPRHRPNTVMEIAAVRTRMRKKRKEKAGIARTAELRKEKNMAIAEKQMAKNKSFDQKTRSRLTGALAMIQAVFFSILNEGNPKRKTIEHKK